MPRSNRWALLPVIILATSGIYELRGATRAKNPDRSQPGGGHAEDEATAGIARAFQEV